MISEWWPNGYGTQTLYNLLIFFKSDDGDREISYRHAKIGFRTIEIIEEEAAHIFGILLTLS